MFAMFTTPSTLVTLFLCLCFCLSVIAISFSLRGWNDKYNVAVVLNVLGLWVGLIAIDRFDIKDIGTMHLLLAESVYLMMRKPRPNSNPAA